MTDKIGYWDAVKIITRKLSIKKATNWASDIKKAKRYKQPPCWLCWYNDVILEFGKDRDGFAEKFILTTKRDNYFFNSLQQLMLAVMMIYGGNCKQLIGCERMLKRHELSPNKNTRNRTVH